VIETPPKDRMAIQTVVAKFDEKIIRSAVEVELERGGQVYLCTTVLNPSIRSRRGFKNLCPRRAWQWATGK